MNVSLTPELERRIAEKVESGLYTTASEVVREALRLLFDADERREQLKAKLNGEIQVALDQLDRGEVVTAEEAWAEMDAIIEATRAGGERFHFSPLKPSGISSKSQPISALEIPKRRVGRAPHCFGRSKN
jgi:antitoxin ParD1/3/4